MDIETILKETGMTEAELISYVNEMSNQGFNSDEITESLMQNAMDKKAEEWKHHTDPAGNSKPGDNGWTDLKRFGSWLGNGISNAATGVANGVANGVSDLKRFGSWVGNGIKDTFQSAADYDDSMNQDLLRDLGMVYKIGLGDDSMLQMWNRNEQEELARKQQQEYNRYWKEMEMAAEEKEKAAAERKEKAEQDKDAAAKRKEAKDALDELWANILDKSGVGTDYSGVSEVLKNTFKKAIEDFAEKGGDTTRYDILAKALDGQPETDETSGAEEESEASKESKPKVNLTELRTERKNIEATKPTSTDWEHRNYVYEYNKKCKTFNAKLKQLRVSADNVSPLEPITPPADPNAQEKEKGEKYLAELIEKVEKGIPITSAEDIDKLSAVYDIRGDYTYNKLSEEEKKGYKKIGGWYFKKMKR